MNIESINALHSAPIGYKAEIDGIKICVVYHDTYLDERITVLESFTSKSGSFAILRNDSFRIYEKYKVHERAAGKCPADKNEVFGSGRDVLSQHVENVDFYAVSAMLPPYDDDAYIALGHPASERSATVDRLGRIFGQRTSYKLLRQLTEEVIVYEPWALYGELGKKKPYQSFLDGKYPLLFNVHDDGGSILESLYVMETGTYRSGGAVYVRNVVTDKKSGDIIKTEFRIVGTDCMADYDAEDIELSSDIFYDCVLNTLTYFEEFEKLNSKAVLPVKELERSYIGTMFTLEGLFSAERMRYGHRIYGTTYHDFFPPNFITALLAYSVNGQTLKAGRLAQYVLANAVDHRGRILYRQGDGQNYGFSASEIGQFLWVLSRYEGIFEPRGCIRPYIGKIIAMGNYLMSKVTAFDELPSVSVIRTCAEADTNERVHDYLENSLWGIRGLEAICSILDSCDRDAGEYRALALRLRGDMDTVYRLCETESPFGKLVPFRLGYTAIPLTLAKCRDTAYEISDGEYQTYIKSGHVRSDMCNGMSDDIVENCYANYRYYPEILSSGLLPDEYGRSVIKMREAIGGDFLGMIRWGEGADDWPAYNLAIYYMEKGLKDKFLRLLYAHAAHHGLIDFHIFYEQIRLDGDFMTVRADTSIPSILLVNLMINMMFCYENIDGTQIELLKGIPESWLNNEAFCIENVYTSKGKLSVYCENGVVRIRFDGSFEAVRLWLNGFDTERLDVIVSQNDCLMRDGDSLIITEAVGEKVIVLE